MMTTTPLEQRMTEILLAVEGVAAVFPPASPLAHLPEVARATLSGAPIDLTRVEVRTPDDGAPRVRARIAVAENSPLPETARAAADALLAAAGTEVGPEATVRLRVSRIS